MQGTCYKTSASYLSLPILLHRPRQFVILGFVLIGYLQARSSIDHGSADTAKPGYIYGTVIGVTDGDTLTIVTAINKTAKIRLSDIDTPELRQPYGKWAKQELSDLTFIKPVSIRLVDIDRYERIIGRIYVNDLDVSAEMVRLGTAWVYRKYAEDQNLYKLENEGKVSYPAPSVEAIPLYQPWQACSYLLALFFYSLALSICPALDYLFNLFCFF